MINVLIAVACQAFVNCHFCWKSAVRIFRLLNWKNSNHVFVLFGFVIKAFANTHKGIMIFGELLPMRIVSLSWLLPNAISSFLISESPEAFCQWALWCFIILDIKGRKWKTSWLLYFNSCPSQNRSITKTFRNRK